MAIAFVRVTTIGRAGGGAHGRSAVGAAAYRAGECLADSRDGREHDYSARTGIGETWIDAPENAPAWAWDREALWNHVESAERRCDARLAREIIIALPREVPPDDRAELVRGYVREQFVARGMVADVALHRGDRGDHNPHAHVLLTTRAIDRDGFGAKVRDWDHRARLDEWKAGWEARANAVLARAGREERIDFRSYAERGEDRLPEVHEGPFVRALEKLGIPTREGDHNRAVRDYNAAARDREEIARAARALEREHERWERRAAAWERHGYTREAARTLADRERERGGEYRLIAEAKRDLDGRITEHHAEGRRLAQESARLERIGRAQAAEERARRERDEARAVGRWRLLLDRQAREALAHAERRLDYAEQEARRCGDLSPAVVARQERELTERIREYDRGREAIRGLERARHELAIGGGQAERDREVERARSRELAHSHGDGRGHDEPGRGRGHDRDDGRGDTWGFDR